MLSRIGVIDGSDAALFRRRPTQTPVFALGTPGAGLSSLALALSMLGYRCCSDLDRIPEGELECLLSDSTDRVFNAYVNIESLTPHVRALTQHYPRSKFIVVSGEAGTAGHQDAGVLNELKGADVLFLHGGNANTWRALCEHLRLAPPSAPYPIVREIGQRRLQRPEIGLELGKGFYRLRLVEQGLAVFFRHLRVADESRNRGFHLGHR